MKFIKRIIIVFLIGLVALGAAEYKKGRDKFEQAVSEKPIETAIEELKGKSNYTSYNEIPHIYFDALVAVEDRRFYKHNGFDIIGSVRAIHNDLKSGEFLEGGSTISQQLAKNLYFPLDNTLGRKIAEIIMAVELEKRYSKQEILELYVNGIYYGSGYYCIYDASKGYFGKKPSDMSEYECTLLVGIPNAPSVYSLDVSLTALIGTTVSSGKFSPILRQPPWKYDSIPCGVFLVLT